jgi:SAM-dependent methyltransferase
MRNRRKSEWFDDDAFWEALTPLMFSKERCGDAVTLLPKALNLAKPKGKDVLDLCCGPGRWAIPLAQLGFRVTGVDKTKRFLDLAKRRARAARVRIDWMRQDMRDFVRPGAFDLALSMFTSFGYFDDQDEDLLVLKNVLASLRPGGALLMEMAGKEILARSFQPTSSTKLPGGSLLVERHEVADGWSRMCNEWMFIKDGKVRTYRFQVTIYSGQELRDRLGQAGFTDVKLFGSFGGDAYDEQAKRLIAVGHRPKTQSI